MFGRDCHCNRGHAVHRFEFLTFVAILRYFEVLGAFGDAQPLTPSLIVYAVQYIQKMPKAIFCY